MDYKELYEQEQERNAVLSERLAELEEEKEEISFKLKRIKDGADHGKNYKLRLHNNLTTYEGLKAFRQIMCEVNGGTEEENDVIHYDYQILDDAWQMLDNLGYKIVRNL